MKQKIIIALITDFGSDDVYVGAVKGAILSRNRDVEIVDISHGVQSYSIINAQFILFSSFRHFPPGTIFYIIIDPGVGTRRRALIARQGDVHFVAPDNGILDAAIGDEAEIFAIREERFMNVSPTFHGRDIFAPIAAMLAMGVPAEELGMPFYDRMRKPFPQYLTQGSRAEGVVVHVDKFGNVITSLPNDVFEKKHCMVESSGLKFPAKYCSTFAELADGEAGIMKGSAGLVELAKNCDSLAAAYGLTIGDAIRISYE
jgi:hypothetical protein